MKPLLDDPALYAEKIALAERKLDDLEQEIAEIGQPAGQRLGKRLQALRIEEEALKRNFRELRASERPDPHRVEQAEALLRHIEREEASLEHEADFLHQSAPSSVTLVAEAGNRVVNALGRLLKGHHPLGKSVFVNHSYETLVNRYGLRREDREENRRD